MSNLAKAQTTVHLAHPPSHVLDYLESSLAKKLPLAGDFTVDREKLEAGGVLFPGATVGRGDGGTSTIQLGGGRMTAWILAFKCTVAGEGTNVAVSVTQFNDTFFQRKTAGSKLNSFIEQIAGALHSDLGS
jgi:hypothetical protein